MSVARDALEPPLRRAARMPRSSTAASLYRWPIYLSCTALALLSNYLLGKDLMWDTLNYHLYAGFSAVHDRFGQDYFAAGPWSYFNPYSYVPFYALAMSGLPALAATSLLAAADSAILWLTYELAVLACPAAAPRVRLAVGVCAVALAFLNPCLIQEIGSSYSDITTAIPVLAGWLLLVRSLGSPSTARAVCAGLLIGAATALKLTNAVHAIAACALLALLPLAPWARLRAGVCYALALGGGFAIAAAPWSYQLARMFGNPLFPLMNGVFRSPEMTTAPLILYRFIPANLLEALWRPFAMIAAVPLVHVEGSAPDMRYAVLVLVSGALAGGWLWRRVRTAPPRPGAAQEAGTGNRVLIAIGTTLALDWVLWLRISANSRYFLPAASVASVVLALLLFRLFANRSKLRNYSLAAVISLQLVQVCMGTDWRWLPVPWGAGPWFQVTVPEKLAREPALYFNFGMQTDSFLAPFLAPGAGFVNLSGAYPLEPSGAAGLRIEALIRRYAPRLRMLVRGARLYEDNEKREPRLSQVDRTLQRFDLRVDPRDCATVAVHGLTPDLEIGVAHGSQTRVPARIDVTYIVSCAVVAHPADHSAEIAHQQRADRVFEHLENACPELFQPSGLLSEGGGDAWERRYSNTDLTAWISHGEVQFRDVPHGDPAVDLGRESDWEREPQRVACGRRAGHYFARLIPAKPGH